MLTNTHSLDLYGLVTRRTQGSREKSINYNVSKNDEFSPL